MTTAISGLNAQSFALENISGNIANSRTTGFKRVDTSFSDLVPDMPPRRELSGSVGASSRNTTNVRGDIGQSQIGTHMALSGEGFFVVRERTGDVAGQPVFSGANLYSRRGDFEVDRNGYLVNGTGNYLMGYQVDPTTGAVAGSQLGVIRIPSSNLAARATTTVEYEANLPKYPLTGAANSAIPGSELLTPALNTATVSATDETNFLNQTIAGQSVTVYDAAGSPINVQMRWGKTSNAAPETWSMFYMSDSAAVGVAPKWTRISNNVQFSAAGQLTAPAGGVINTPFTVDGVVSPAINLTFGATGLTQFADPNGQLNPNRITQDGYPTGTLQGIAVADGGRIMGSYSNGQTVALAQVPIAEFPASNMLKRLDGGTFEATLESGTPLVQAGGDGVIGASLEGSNADIADEFSKMIVTQQAYSANTRVLTTAQSMLQDVMNIIR